MDKRYQNMLQRRADLTQERNALIEQYDELLEGAGDELTDDERASADDLESRIEAVEAKQEQLEADVAREEKRRALKRQQVTTQPVRISGVRERIDDDGGRGFNGLGDFALAVREASRQGGLVDDRLRPQAAPTNYHQETGSSEGYMVPPAYSDRIWELVYDSDDDEILNRVDFENTMSNIVTLLADETTPWGSTGINASWRSEGAQMSADKLDTDARQVRLHELYAFVLATDELLQDAPRLEQRVTTGASRAIRWEMAEAIVRGTGAGQPLGFVNAASLVSVAKESGQAADTIQAENIVKMYSRQLDVAGSVWLANIDTYPELATMTLGDQPIFLQGTNIASAPYGLLLGRPIFFTEHADTLGDQTDIMLVSLRNYYAARRTAGPQFASSIHLFFDYGVQAFRWTFRMGGQPYLSAAVTPNLSSNTKSHFVTLDARA